VKFSILLPTHNRADVLPLALASLLAQTENDWELFLVGDGCTDGTAEVVAKFSDPRIQWFDLPKAPGFGYRHRNFAFRQMRGDLVAYLTHDDLWLPDHLASLAHFIELNNFAIAYSRVIWVEPGGALFPGDFDLNDDETRGKFLAFAANGIPASCVVHRRDCFSRYGFWDEQRPSCADWEMWTRIISGGDRVGYFPTPTCLHFRANWREASNVLSPLVARPDLRAQLPDLQLPTAQNEQTAAWERLGENPGRTHSLRAAVQRADELLKRAPVQSRLESTQTAAT